jgi:hypothetical protein
MQKQNLIMNIREGMTVYARDGKKVGRVEDVQFGDEDLSQPGVETSDAQDVRKMDETLVDVVAQAFSLPNRAPEEIRERLLRYGYMKVDTGLLASDRYVEADQIADVNGDRVELSVTRDELVKA